MARIADNSGSNRGVLDDIKMATKQGGYGRTEKSNSRLMDTPIFT